MEDVICQSREYFLSDDLSTTISEGRNAVYGKRTTAVRSPPQTLDLNLA